MTEKQKQLIADYQSGLTIKAIAKKHRIGANTLYKTLDLYGIDYRVSTITTVALKQSIQSCLDGELLKDAAKKLGCSVAYLSERVAHEKRRINHDIIKKLGLFDSMGREEARDCLADQRVYVRRRGVITHLVIPVGELL